MVYFESILQCNYEEAESLRRKALDLFISLFPAAGNQPQASFDWVQSQHLPRKAQIILGVIFSNYGHVKIRHGDYDRALDNYQKSLASTVLQGLPSFFGGSLS